jgi:chaperonin cofactor prefoldin
VLNFWPTHDAFDGRADIREVFQHFERGADFDRVQVRCWKKAEDVDLQSSGGHDVRFQSRRVFPLRFLMRHFPVRSQAHGHRKVFEERKPRFSDDERGRGWHVQYDGLDEGHRFTRDPDTLEAYDPDAVRARLQIEHRGVESLQLEADELRHQGHELTARLEALGQALRDEQAARAAEVSALRHDVAARTEEVAARTEEVQQLAADVAGHLLARQELERQYGDLDRRHAVLDHRNAELQRQFEQLEQRYRDLDRHSRELERERGQLLHGVADLEQQLLAIRQSWSWKVTAPLRALGRPRTP